MSGAKLTYALYVRGPDTPNVSKQILQSYDAIIDMRDYIYVTFSESIAFRVLSIDDAYIACSSCNNVLHCYDDHSAVVVPYMHALRTLTCIYLSRMQDIVSGDMLVEAVDNFSGGASLKIVKFSNVLLSNIDEMAYLQTLRQIIMSPARSGRNGLVWSKFGGQLQFNLIDSFPLLTTRRIFFRGVVEELLFFLAGSTDTNILSRNGVKIWEKNTSAEFLESRGLNYQPGDMGPMYGFQLRHFGSQYKGCEHVYGGIDQIQKCIDTLIADPFSRRIIMTTYNPADVEQGVLYPCHGITIQFYVREEDNNKLLSCHMYQRSADFVLGVPFNIASYALLTYIICKQINDRNTNAGLAATSKFIPDKLIMSFGDMHVYESHRAGVERMLKRTAYPFPKLKINNNGTKVEDFELIDYSYHPGIKFDMVA